jgi:hypothetical protein
VTQDQRPGQHQEIDAAVWTGRAFGLLIVVIALAVGTKVANDVDSVGGDSVWVFLAAVMTPLGMGFLVLVASEILNRVGGKS